MLTKSIDAANRENAGLKHEVMKLTNEVKKMEEMKN
jgi:cell division protein FtsB